MELAHSLISEAAPVGVELARSRGAMQSRCASRNLFDVSAAALVGCQDTYRPNLTRPNRSTLP